MDYCFAIASIIEKLSLSWKDIKHSLKHKKEDLTLKKLGTNLCIKECIQLQEGGKECAKNMDILASAINHMEEGKLVELKTPRKI